MNSGVELTGGTTLKSNKSDLLLPTLSVGIGFGERVEMARCILDLASQRSYVSSKVVLALGVNLASLPTHSYHIKTFIGSKLKHVREIRMRLFLDSGVVPLRFLIESNLSLDHEVEGLGCAINNIKRAKVSLADVAFQRDVTNDALTGINMLLGVDALQHMHFENVPCLSGKALKIKGGLIPFGSVSGFTNNHLVGCAGSGAENPVVNQQSNSDFNFTNKAASEPFEPSNHLVSCAGSGAENPVVNQQSELVFNFTSSSPNLAIIPHKLGEEHNQIKSNCQRNLSVRNMGVGEEKRLKVANHNSTINTTSNQQGSTGENSSWCRYPPDSAMKDQEWEVSSSVSKVTNLDPSETPVNGCCQFRSDPT